MEITHAVAEVLRMQILNVGHYLSLPVSSMIPYQAGKGIETESRTG